MLLLQEGAKGGAKGFIKGFGKGLLGAVVKPTAGVLSLTQARPPALQVLHS